jgi:hypothetical protein
LLGAEVSFWAVLVSNIRCCKKPATEHSSSEMPLRRESYDLARRKKNVAQQQVYVISFLFSKKK